jgi:cob(I)alamin adenosyltransferase
MSEPRSIATRTGDDGTTSLLFGQRVPKDHFQIEAVGAFDELNAAIGMAKAFATSDDAKHTLEEIQRDLVALMGELVCAETDAARYAASKFAQIGDANLARVDAALAKIEQMSPSFDGWATPGATPAAATLDVARTAARRAERRMQALPKLGRSIRPVVAQYVNRVSDLLWLMARAEEARR